MPRKSGGSPSGKLYDKHTNKARKLRNKGLLQKVLKKATNSSAPSDQGPSSTPNIPEACGESEIGEK